MAGHNKWSKIKHKKAITDAKKSKVFSKHIKSIQIESRLADGDVSSPGLRSAIDAAKKDNVPKDNIERAIKKGVGGEGNEMERITYEAYGPGGVALVIEVLTDSRNRATAEVRHILNKVGAYELAAPGSATWAFEKEGQKWVAQQELDLLDEDIKKLDTLVEALEESDEVQGVFTNAS